MFKDKINKIIELIEKIKTDITIPLISEFLDWFYELLIFHFNKTEPKLVLKKWDIYFINLWKNIWSELNKTRPCVIYSIKKANFWNTVLVIPLKSYKWKKLNNFQILIKKSKKSLLEKDSFLDLSWIRQISKKRILTKKWYLEKDILIEIDSKILNIFWIKKSKE